MHIMYYTPSFCMTALKPHSTAASCQILQEEVSKLCDLLAGRASQLLGLEGSCNDVAVCCCLWSSISAKVSGVQMSLMSLMSFRIHESKFSNLGWRRHQRVPCTSGSQQVPQWGVNSTAKAWEFQLLELLIITHMRVPINGGPPKRIVYNGKSH